MKTNFKRRLEKIHLKPSKCLNPIFEAIMNSIHSIDDRGIKDGRIDIVLYSDHQLLSQDFKNENQLNEIDEVVVTDNGIGFNDQNYESFNELDTENKKDRGGRGIGRLLWLKAFDSVQIESIFNSDKNKKKRTFSFSLNNEGISDHKLIEIPEDTIFTKIKLRGFQKKFKEKFPNSLNNLCQKIVEHFLLFFVYKDCPNIYVSYESNQIHLNEMYDQKINKHIVKNDFTLNEIDFQLLNVKLYNDTIHQHNTIGFCADKRTVILHNLSTYINDLNQKLIDNDGNKFIYMAYVTSTYFDEIVNEERTNLEFIEEEDLFSESIPKKEIIDQCTQYTEKYLEDHLKKIREDKFKTIEKHINNKAPEFKILLKHRQEDLKNINKVKPLFELEMQLHKIFLDYKLDLRKKGNTLIKKSVKDQNDYQKMKEDYDEYLEEENELGKTQLAEYVTHRRIILKLFEKRLKINKDHKYYLEDDIHSLIFPLKKTSFDVEPDEQNLWLIDERLVFHQFLSSDKPFNSLNEIGKIDSKDRCDLLVLDNPISLTDSDEPYQNIIIIEFKRPNRKNYAKDDNPIDQVYDYILKIKSGNAEDKGGRQIDVAKNPSFYCYIICDLTEKIKKFSINAGFRSTPDGRGYYGYNEGHNAYVEVISLKKIYQDSWKRNKILFDKLNIT